MDLLQHLHWYCIETTEGDVSFRSIYVGLVQKTFSVWELTPGGNNFERN